MKLSIGAGPTARFAFGGTDNRRAAGEGSNHRGVITIVS